MENIASGCGDTLRNALTSCWRRFGQRLMVIRDPLANAKIVLETLWAMLSELSVETFGKWPKKWSPVRGISCHVSSCSEWMHNEKKSTKKHPAKRKQGELLGLLPTVPLR